MLFRQLFDKSSSTYTYLIASAKGREALIIDPVLENVEQYIKLLNELDLKLVKEYIGRWKELGNVPHNKRYIEGKFSKALDTLFNTLKMDKTELEMIKFENKLENLSNASDSRFLDNERSYIRKKIDEVIKKTQFQNRRNKRHN